MRKRLKELKDLGTQYPHLGLKDTIGNVVEVKFNDPLPDLFKTA